MYIKAEDTDSPESYTIEIPHLRAKEIMQAFDNDYDKLV